MKQQPLAMARVEHVFGVVKQLWGFGTVRYCGLQKNAIRAFTALALANIYLSRPNQENLARRPYPAATNRSARAACSTPGGLTCSVSAGVQSPSHGLGWA